MIYSRADFARGVECPGLKGVRTHITSSDAVLEVEGGFLRVQTTTGIAMVPLANVLFLWAASEKVEPGKVATIPLPAEKHVSEPVTSVDKIDAILDELAKDHPVKPVKKAKKGKDAG